MLWILFFILMGVLGRLSGNGFGSKWGVSWLPELIHSLPYGLALGWAVHTLTGKFWASHGLTAVLWPLGYEIGSHARGRVERFGLDPHAVSEFMSAALGGVSIFAFVQIIQIIAS